jgi:hypothetical protein
MKLMMMGEEAIEQCFSIPWKININATWCRLTPCCCKTPSQIPAILATITSQSSLVGWVGAVEDVSWTSRSQELIKNSF